jgi:hypothetical protein
MSEKRDPTHTQKPTLIVIIYLNNNCQVQELKKDLPNGKNVLWWKLKPHENEVKLL